MSTKPTPGPWEALPICQISGWVDIIVRDDSGFSSLPFAACKHFDQEANARLIAAAPDLLEALRELRAEVLRLRGNYPLPHNQGYAAMAAADTAIAKAEGRDT